MLTSQFRRAADSIILNIAEGAGNRSKVEFLPLLAGLGYFIRSGYECVGCIDEIRGMLVRLPISLSKQCISYTDILVTDC